MENQSKFFKTFELYNGVTAISGLLGELAFLIRGRKKALLIDTLTGIGSLKSFCRELTDLPLAVVNSHGHVDHVGSNSEFKYVYIHPLDIDMSIYQASMDKKIEFLSRKGFLENLFKKGVSKEDLVNENPFFTIPINDGEYFDLGDREIEVIHIPGHSRGSIALLDIKERTAFIGDSICDGMLLNLENSTSVEEYIEGMEHLKQHIDRFDRMYWSHDIQPLLPVHIKEAIEAGHDILNNRDNAVVNREHPFYCTKSPEGITETGKKRWANINYNKDRIFKKERSKLIIEYKNRDFNIFD